MQYNPKHYPSLETCKALKEAGIGVGEDGKPLTKAFWHTEVESDGRELCPSICTSDKRWFSEPNLGNPITLIVTYPCPDLHELLVMDACISTEPVGELVVTYNGIGNILDGIAMEVMDCKQKPYQPDVAIINARLIAHNTL